MDVGKYFIALVIPDPFYNQVEALKHALLRDHGLKGGLRSPAHITLHRPFEWNTKKEAQLIEKLAQFKFEKPFEIELKNFSFFEPRVIYVDMVPNENLVRLYEALRRYTKRELKLFNEWESERGFHPHVTIANRDLKKPKFFELQKEFSEKTFSGVFTVDTFSLLKLDETWKENSRFSFI